jgi:membrane peptidoglycan carboxypeptidase
VNQRPYPHPALERLEALLLVVVHWLEVRWDATVEPGLRRAFGAVEPRLRRASGAIERGITRARGVRRGGGARASGAAAPRSSGADPAARLRAAAASAPAIGEVGIRTARTFSRALGRQIEAAREVRPTTTRVIRDSRGRRVRASANGRRRRGSRGGRAPSNGSGGWMPNTAKAALVLVLALGGFLGSSQMFIDYAAELPDAHQLTSDPLPEDTLIYAADGSVIADLRDPGSGFSHYYQPLSKMQEGQGWLPQATVAIEDANFWNEPGIDPSGIARAAWSNFQHRGTTQGASTITQQLVKLRLLKDSSQTLDRKIKEAILAVQVDHTYSKRQILEMYLNSVEYGDFARGAQAAAQNYFRKHTSQLDLAEASMLAGIPQNPNYNSPLVNPERAKLRQQQVLDAMVKTHVITRKQADAAYAEKLNLNPPEDSIKAAPGYVNWIVNQLVAKYGKNATYNGGLHVYTSLNPTLQGIAEKAVADNVARVQREGQHMNQGSMVSIDPKTGMVLTMVGSVPGAPGYWYNYADLPQNPGSTAKLFTYTAAIASGKFTMTTSIPGGPLTVNMPGQSSWSPKNFNTSQYPSCPLQQCMGNSLNIPAAYVEVATGVDKVVDMSRTLGADPYFFDGQQNVLGRPSSDFGPAFTLGGSPMSVVSMANAAATIANGGVHHPATGILRITASDGTEIYNYDPAAAAKQVLDPKVAFIMQTIMSNDDNRAQIFGRGSALTLPGRRVGAKTGTSEEFRDEWTLGYTPSLASAFWFGNDDNSPISSLGRGYDAIYGAAPGWHEFMNNALTTMGVPGSEWYAPPPGIVPAGRELWLLPGTSLHQPTPPLPSWARSTPAPRPSPSPKSGGNNDGGRGGNGNGDQPPGQQAPPAPPAPPG